MKLPRIVYYLAAAVALLLLAVILLAVNWPSPRPPQVIQVPWIVPGNTDTVHVTDSDAARRAKEWQRVADAFKDSLGAERAARESWQFAADLWQGQWYRTDSALAALLARSALFAEVQYRRGTVAVLATRGDSIYAAPAWRCSRNTWTLSATPAGPVLRWRRFPVDVGVEFAATGWTPYDSVAPCFAGRLAVTARYGGVTWWMGPQVGPTSLRPCIAAGLKIGREF